jgi:hypothetical protein
MARSAHKYASVEGILPLIRMAAGDPEMLTEYDGTLGLNVEEWQNASVFYLQTILSRKSVEDVYGVLGLPKGASLDLVRVHRRWLSKWLHPDRNPNQWEAALFLKVQKAAQIIEGNKLLLLVSDKSQQDEESRRKKAPSRKKFVRRGGPSLAGSLGLPTFVILGAVVITYLVATNSWGLVSNSLRGLGMQ